MTQRKELLVRARKFAATKKKGESLFCIELEAFDGRSVGLNHELLLTFMTDFAMEAVRAERKQIGSDLRIVHAVTGDGHAPERCAWCRLIAALEGEND